MITMSSQEKELNAKRETESMENGELIKLFDKTGHALIAMVKEAEDLEKKYGEKPQWVQRKKANLQVMIDFYDQMKTQLSFYQDMLSNMAINYDTLRILHYKNENHLNHVQVAQLMGFEDVERWKKLDSLDQRLKTIANELT